MPHPIPSTSRTARVPVPPEGVSDQSLLTLRAACLVILLISLTLVAEAQVAVPAEGVSGVPLQIIEVDGWLYVGTDQGAYRTHHEKERFTPVSGVRGEVTLIKEAGGSIWFVTSEGLFMLGKGAIEAKQISGAPADVNDIIGGADGRLLAATTNDIFLVRAAESNATRVYATPSDSVITNINIIEAGGQLWGKTDEGLYQLVGSELKLVAVSMDSLEVKEIAGEAWLIGSELYRVVEGELVIIKNLRDSYSDVYESGGKVLVKSPEGLFIVEENNSARRVVEGDFSGEVNEFNGKLLFGDNTPDDQLFLAEGDSPPRPITGVSGKVTTVGYGAGRLWLITQQGVFSVDDGTYGAKLVPDIPGSRGDPEISELIVVEAAGDTWVATADGVYRVGRRGARRVAGLGDPSQQITVRSIVEMFGDVWVISDLEADEGYLYRVRRDEAKLVASGLLPYSDPVDVIGGLWLRSPEGVVRVDNSASLTVTLDNSESWWKSAVGWLLPEEYFIEGVVIAKPRYVGSDGRLDPYVAQPGELQLIATTNKEEFNAALAAKDGRGYSGSLARGFELSLGSGRQVVYASVRDRWGNTFVLPPRDVRVVPGALTFAVLAVLFWLLVAVVLLALAPYVRFCHDIVMNPWFRNWGSAWLIPLILSILPFARHHLLRRYLREVRRDPEFAEWKKHYVYPTDDFLPAAFGRRLDAQRRLLLAGQSGIGKTSYFKHLTAYYAGTDKRGLLPRRTVPVYIPLSSYRGDSPEVLIYDQLSNFGRMNDAQLNAWFLKQGGFVIFLDGLNEISDESCRAQLSGLVNRLWKVNFFCLSSQQSYPEFSGLTEIRLASLGSDKIDELIRRRLPSEEAERTIGQLTDETYRLYSIPRDLEFALEIVQRGDTRVLPESRSQLYSAALSPVLDAWSGSGQGDYTHRLYKHAYEMLRAREPFFDVPGGTLPDEITNTLYNQRFLIKRSERFLFRHDLVRAFLAAQHFATHWKSLLAEGDTIIDINWLEMLKFSIPILGVAKEVKGLLESVLAKSSDKKLVGGLFNWLELTYPSLSRPWGQSFKLRYGEVMLQSIR